MSEMCAFCGGEVPTKQECSCHGAVQYRECSAPLRARIKELENGIRAYLEADGTQTNARLSSLIPAQGYTWTAPRKR